LQIVSINIHSGSVSDAAAGTLRRGSGVVNTCIYAILVSLDVNR